MLNGWTTFSLALTSILTKKSNKMSDPAQVIEVEKILTEVENPPPRLLFPTSNPKIASIYS
jgi:hypothetical protein